MARVRIASTIAFFPVWALFGDGGFAIALHSATANSGARHGTEKTATIAIDIDGSPGLEPRQRRQEHSVGEAKRNPRSGGRAIQSAPAAKRKLSGTGADYPSYINR